MRESGAVMLVLVFLTASCIAVKPALSSAAVAEDSWVTKEPMQLARNSLGVAVVNGKIYAIGGGVENGVVGTNEEYDPATDTWSFKKPMPTPRQAFAIASYQNKIYCIGGYSSDGSITGVNEVYDPATDTWETKSSVPTPRRGLKANVANGKIYFIGGAVPDNSSLTGFSILSLNEVYDPAKDSWTTKAAVPTAVSGVLSAVVDSQIYVIMDDLNQIYDANTDTWSLGTPLPHSSMGYARAEAATGVNAPKRIYVFGGGETQVYNSESDSWTFGAGIPTKRVGFGVAVVNDQFYVIGGFTETFDIFWNSDVTLYATNEQYTPFGYGTVPPIIHVVSPESKMYVANNVSLAFTVNKPVLWMGYSLDGQDNVTISGNTTLAGLTNGLHNITVYAKDSFENMGASETVTFTIAKETETFSIRLVAAAVIVVAAVGLVAAVGVGLSVYLKKRK